MSVFEAKKIKSFRALQDYVVVTDMNFKEKISHGGIIIPNSDGKLEGVHPRWGKVYSVGNKQQDIKQGQYVLVKHGRWTRGIDIEDDTGKKTIRKVDPNDILLVSDEPVNDDTMSDKVY
jgi:co-chaperonin GroES (HSP10)